MQDYLEIEDLRIPLLLQYDKRKTLAITVTREEQLLVRIPTGMSEQAVWRFLNQKRYWIYKQTKRMKEENRNRVYRSEEEIRQLKIQAREILTKKTLYYQELLQVEHQRIRIADQKTRWGSCSSKGTISYNWHLVLMPEEIVDYVVVHELCHLLEMNHSKHFWERVEAILPDYKKRREWLKQNGNQYT